MTRSTASVSAGHVVEQPTEEGAERAAQRMAARDQAHSEADSTPYAVALGSGGKP